MILTFAQYSILSATYAKATSREVQQQTTFDRMMISYYIMGLLNVGLLKASDDENSESTCYELTELGMSYIDDYERANPALVIKRSLEETPSLYI